MSYLWSAEEIDNPNHPGVMLTRAGDLVQNLSRQEAAALARDLLSAAYPEQDDPR